MRELCLLVFICLAFGMQGLFRRKHTHSYMHTRMRTNTHTGVEVGV
jgi:hypothetical protein